MLMIRLAFAAIAVPIIWFGVRLNFEIADSSPLFSQSPVGFGDWIAVAILLVGIACLIAVFAKNR
jgi:hypothetical protein